MSWQQLKKSKMLFVLVGGLLVSGCSSTGTEPSAVNDVTPTASSPANTQEKGLTTCAVAPEYATTKPTFALATSGCPMAHCSPDMSDRVSIAPPRSSQVQTLWQDQAPIGSSFGLGCSSNGSIVVCSYANADDPGVDTVVAYNASGQRLWSSGNCMGRLALGSAPLIGQDGSVIAASEGYMVRFDANGKVIWRTTLPEGLPISPVVTSSGVILIAASGQGAAASSPLSTYDSQTGAALGELCVKENPTDANCFDTINTPGVEGNRAYISMAKPDADNVG
ncbi:MAG TPA: hypothetical protein DCE42_27275 [Myxococcales bacterium]|nr:hypothetical protein [Deltaproteobacteria bacterium]MBU53405.1 hypothetical protein [Deltaproteobacteria bacterium]HAA58494.1 hypothetical protein [Myxococcales bacterium]|tara:strand:+ start:3984 stop:4820 length:837 start_codon:yes stop_codon:yes gene_type:complete